MIANDGAPEALEQAARNIYQKIIYQQEDRKHGTSGIA